MESLRHQSGFYKQYKTDTDFIAKWLVGNALMLSPMDSTDKAKNNPRKNPKNHGKIRPSRIQVSDFIRMAHIIAELKPAIKIPPTVDDAFRRAIEKRKQVSDWYGQNRKDEHESNQRHSYFIDVLKATWEILRPLERSHTAVPSFHSRSQTGQQGQSHESSVRLANRFAALQVDGSPEPDTVPDDTADDTADDTSIEPADIDSIHEEIADVVVIKNEQDIEAEFFIAMYSCFRWVLAIRDFLHQRFKVWI